MIHGNRIAKGIPCLMCEKDAEIERLLAEIKLLNDVDEASEECIYTNDYEGITIEVEMDDRYQKYLDACEALERFRYPNGHPDDDLPQTTKPTHSSSTSTFGEPEDQQETEQWESEKATCKHHGWPPGWKCIECGEIVPESTKRNDRG